MSEKLVVCDSDKIHELYLILATEFFKRIEKDGYVPEWIPAAAKFLGLLSAFHYHDRDEQLLNDLISQYPKEILASARHHLINRTRNQIEETFTHAKSH